MNYLKPIQQRLKNEMLNVPKLIGQLIILNSGNIVDDVKRRWMYGKSVDGGIIGRYADNEYRLFKMTVNPLAGGNVDLILDGGLSDNLTVTLLGGNKYKIFSTDKKYNKIGKKYGFEEFGLTEVESEQLLSELSAFALETIFNKIY